MPLVAGWDHDLPAGFTVTRSLDTYYRGAAVISLSAQHYTFGQPSPGQATYGHRVSALYRWAQQHNYILIQSGRIYPEVTDQYDTIIQVRHAVPAGWIVCTGESRLAAAHSTWHPDEATACGACGATHEPYTYKCPVLGTLLACPTCGRRNVRVFETDVNITFPRNRYLCNRCGSPCAHPGCQVFVDSRTGARFCSDHGFMTTCAFCGVYVSWGRDEPGPYDSAIGVICEGCVGNLCSNCDRPTDRELQWSDVLERDVCRDCLRDSLRNATEEWAHDGGEGLAEFPTITGREVIRLCGIEIEGANGTNHGGDLARELYNQNLSRNVAMTGYHGDTLSFAHVERDSSVDWECVIGPLNMADETHVARLKDVMRIIRTGVHEGRYKLDLRCGVHVHVSADSVGLTQAYNLSHIFTYLEDPLYRIGAAKWPMHRACQGNTGTRSIPKYTRKLDFVSRRGGNGGGHDDHYYALSFSNYFRAMRECGCGALQAGVWDDCTCNLNKCTFEFRLFNTTANARKMYAYLALCQAMVAHAIEIPEIRRPNELFPGMPFLRKTVKNMTDVERDASCEAWVPRLRYIFNELPLTREEKDAVAYCVTNSEIAVGLGERWTDLVLREEAAA